MVSSVSFRRNGKRLRFLSFPCLGLGRSGTASGGVTLPFSRMPQPLPDVILIHTFYRFIHDYLQRLMDR